MTKYVTQSYKRHSAYTSYPSLSLEQAKALEDTCYDEIPETVETHLGDIEIYNRYGEFLPINDAYENPGKVWSHNKKSDWYTHVSTGVRVKKEVYKSPNYDKPNGYEECTITITVKIPVQDGRGQNPNSHHNKKKSQALVS